MNFTRYDFCVDELGNEIFRPCPDGRFVEFADVEEYAKRNMIAPEDDDIPFYIPSDFHNSTPKATRSGEEQYIYLPMKRGVRHRYNKETDRFQQSLSVDTWSDLAEFHNVPPTKELLEMLKEIQNA